MQKHSITTERLILREITGKDADLIVSWRKNPDVYKYFRSAHKITFEEHMEWFNDNYLLDDSQLQFIAEEKAERIPVGVFGIKKCANQKDCVEVSYLLDTDAQGNGYAQEAVLGMMRFAKQDWNMKKAVAEIHKDNYASQKMIKRIDFVVIGRKDNFLIYERMLCYT